MDFVIVTHGPDIRLLRHCLLSYDVYFGSKSKIFIFVSREDAVLLDRIKLPQNSELIYTDNFPELARAKNGVVEQIYLKLISHRFVTSDYYCIIDSDFLFLRPTFSRDFFSNGKPVWFYSRWEGHDLALRWKPDSEAFLGFDIDHLFLEFQQHVFIKHVARALEEMYPLQRILSLTSPSEYLIYGAFSHRNYRELYEFVAEGGPLKPICRKVNQIPPTYCHLDPNCSYQQFRESHYVVFWSHWDLAEEKMVEFFEDSQKSNYGRIVRPADRSYLLPVIHAPYEPGNGSREIYGMYSDGWMKPMVKFSIEVPASREFVDLEILVPSDPSNQAWRLNGTVITGENHTPQHFCFQPGLNHLQVVVEPVANPRTILVEIQLGEGFRYENNTDGREFRARLMSMSV